jgi:hypothetical protein
MKGYLLHIAWNQSSTEGPPSVDFDDYEVGEFERTIPRFDSEVLKTGSKIGLTDSCKMVMQNILSIKARP